MTVTTETWKHDYIPTNGIRLHYVTQGEGPLMLMLHGFPECWYSWRKQIPEFARDYKVVALDLRGYNLSDKPAQKSAYVMAEFIQDIQGVITGLGYDRCTLVGHDWGGAIAWNFAYAHPELLERLIVLNLPHPARFAQGLLTPQQLLRSSYIFFFQLPFLPEAVLRWRNYQLIEQAFKRTAVNPATFSPTDLEVYKTAIDRPGALTAMLNYYRNVFRQGIVKPRWDVLRLPTLLIWGEKDVALGKELTYHTDQYVADLTIRYIPNGSHWVQQECPDLVNQSMQTFLATGV